MTHTVSMEDLMDDHAGICLDCGEIQSAEPDAQGNRCGCCGEHRVFGMSAAMDAGVIEIEGSE